MDVDKLAIQNFVNVVPTLNDHLVIVILGNGFIITGMLWASLLYFAIEKRYSSVLITSIILAILSCFGVIHSVFISGQLYLPTHLPDSVRNVPFELAIGYLFFGFMTYILGKKSQ